MKKLVLSLTALLLNVCAFAGVVSRSQAEIVARKVLGSSSVDCVWNGLGDMKYGSVPPAFYVFNGEGGWTIISADDCATPVLMHGDGLFNPDDIPDNMRSLLKEIEYNIFAARNQGLPQSPEIRLAWENHSAVTKAGYAVPAEVLLETASWDQGSPYSDKCPTVKVQGRNYSCVTGCVATAMAIVMRYFRWPEVGRGTIPGYTASNGVRVSEININGFKYEWDNMPLVYTSSATAAQKTAVASLMAHAGAMVKMEYSPNGSGALSSNIIPAMVKYMAYSASAHELYRFGYTNQTWFNMLKAELDAGRPVIYGGGDMFSEAGHQFVCDGYNSNSEIHINWGWSGYLNSWYSVCYLGPTDQETDGGVYSNSDSALFGLVPDKSGSEPEKPVSDFYIYEDIAFEQESVAKSESFIISAGIAYIGSDVFSGQISALLVDKDGNVKDVLSDETDDQVNDLEGGYAYSFTFNCVTDKDFVLGDHISIGYKNPDNSWYIFPKYDSGILDALALFDVTMIDSPSTFTVGQVFYPGLIPGMKPIAEEAWYLDNNQINTETIKMTTAGKHVIKVVVTYADGSTETIVKQVAVN